LKATKKYIKMKNRKLLKRALFIILGGVVVGGSIAAYMFFKPHRDVQSSSTDFSMNASDLVSEYMKNPQSANDKYLDDAGLSKILEVTGTIASITEDFNNQKVVLIKEKDDKAGVSATFTAETNQSASQLKIGQKVTIKGVIRSGASYDEDLELYENVILEKSDVVQQ